MKIVLGENLRKLRNERHMTQEQLAEALDVSPQAVSRWENGAGFPDISVLPVIANLFNVTTDHLLGVDIVHKHEEIERILEQDIKFHNDGRILDSIILLREKLKIYPSEANLLQRLSGSVYSYYFQSDIEHSDEDKKKAALEVIELGKKAIKYSKEAWIDNLCKQLMIFCYTYLDERETALKIAKEFPNMWLTSDLLLPGIYADSEPKKASEMYQNSLIQFVQAIDHFLCHIRRFSDFTDREKLDISILQEKMLLIFFGEKPLFFNENLFNAVKCQCTCYLHLDEKEKCLDSLERAYKYAEGFEERPEVGKYSVHWLSLTEDRRNFTTKHTTQTLYDDLLGYIYYRELHKIFDGNERFNSIMSKLEEKT